MKKMIEQDNEQYDVICGGMVHKIPEGWLPKNVEELEREAESEDNHEDGTFEFCGGMKVELEPDPRLEALKKEIEDAN